jgi:hypothetical protein
LLLEVNNFNPGLLAELKATSITVQISVNYPLDP